MSADELGNAFRNASIYQISDCRPSQIMEDSLTFWKARFCQRFVPGKAKVFNRLSVSLEEETMDPPARPGFCCQLAFHRVSNIDRSAGFSE